MDFTTRVIIVDEQTLFCQAIVRLLKTVPQIEAVASATTLESAADVAKGFRPDVMVVSPAIEKKPQKESVDMLKRASHKTRILWLDDELRPIHVRSMIDANVHGYWTKEATFSDLVQAIFEITLGQFSFCPEVHQYIMMTPEGLRLNPEQRLSAIDSLTPRELEIFTHLATGMTVADCAQHLGLSPRTVDNHKVRLMRKLHVHKSLELAWIAIQEGLIPDNKKPRF